MCNRTRRLRRLLLNSSVRSKLLWVYFGLLVLPLGFFTLYVSSRVSAVVQEQTFAAARKTFEETTDGVTALMDKLENVLDILTHNNLVYQMSSTNPQDYPYIHQLEDNRTLGTAFSNLQILSGVDRIRLYVGNDYIYSMENRYIFPMERSRGSNWYRALEQPQRHPADCWFSPPDFFDQPANDQNWFSAMRTIYDPSDVLVPLAVLRVDLDAAQVGQAIRQTPITENGLLLLLSGETVLLSAGREVVSSQLVAQLASLPPNEWGTIQSENQKYYVNYTTLRPAGWKIATLIPYSDIYRLGDELRIEMLSVMLLLAVLAYGLAYVISKSTLHRLSLLTHTMQDVETGNVTVRLDPVGGDEIGQLMGSFSHMMERIQQLMDASVEHGREIKNLELKALQAQINPHFLYNSLDLINCIAREQDIPEIVAMVTALARFYKLSLSRGRDIIPIADELTHAEMYLAIQNIRFENRIHVEWDIAEEIRRMFIIKIVLQPIIENAVIHGIFRRKGKSGTVRIQGRLEGDGIFISVSDDGVGMPPEIVAANFLPPSPTGLTEATGGYGIRNINDRLRLAYGDEYGLSCKSKVGIGTTITIHIPVVQTDETANRLLSQ